MSPFFRLLISWLLLQLVCTKVSAQVGQPWVATTDTHTAVVHADGTLWTWGANGNGQLGDGTTTDHLTPAQVGVDSTWQRVAVSNGNTFALKRDGSLWSWGANQDGQLGTGTSGAADQLFPQRVGTSTSWVSLTAGEGFVLALHRDGTLWGWGANYDGQLGDGSTRGQLSPILVTGGAHWRHVTAGAYHVVAVRQDGTLWTWGYNEQGQLGNGTQTSTYQGISHGNAPSPVPQQIGRAHSWVSSAAGLYNSGAVQQDGTAWMWGYGYFAGQSLQTQLTPQPVALPIPARSIALGWYSTLIVACDGALWGYGMTYQGTLGDGTYTTRDQPVALSAGQPWTQVVMGQEHAIGLQPDGSIWGWGANVVGAIGHPSLSAFALFTPRQAGSLTNWASVSTGQFHTLALQRDGSLWSWGQNSWGELGDGMTTNRRLPTRIGTVTTWQTVAAGYSYSLALRRDGTLWAWGANHEGQLGDGTTTSRAVPQQIGTAANWASIAPGSGHTAALRQDGTLWLWGANRAGQLGQGTTAASLLPIQLGTATWRSVAVGIRHTVAVRADSTLWAWGDNKQGQLGDSTYVARLRPVQVGRRHDWVRVGAGAQHTLAIRADGTLWAWGDNRTAQLGIGTQDFDGVTTPKQVGKATDWTWIAGGAGHSVGLQRTGSWWSWGWGYGSPWSSAAAYSLVPKEVVSGQAWGSAASGTNAILAVRTDGTLWARGSNSLGELGTPSYALEPLLIQAGAGLHLDRLSLYPNPAHSIVTLVAPGCSAPLLLFDLSGRQVRQLPPCTKTLDVQGLATGVYLVRQGTAVTRLVVE